MFERKGAGSGVKSIFNNVENIANGTTDPRVEFRSPK